MSRTNKGGVRLRVITGLTAAMAIVAGIYAGTLHAKTPAASCSFQGVTSIFEGKTLQLTCTGLAANTTYDIVSNGDSHWGTLPPLMTNSIGGGSANVPTVAATTVAASYVDIKLAGVTAASSTPIDAYNLDFSSVNLSPLKNANEALPVSGLLGSQTYKFGPLDETNETPDLSGWDHVMSGSPSGSGTAMSPYLFGNPTPGTVSIAASSGSITSGNVFKMLNNSGTDIPTRVGIYDNSGTLIGISPQITSAT